MRTHHGLTLAAAGIDASNVEPGHVVLLPVDPDASARRLRARLAALTGRTVAVVVTDTAGRAWRHGQTDLAVGAAGLRVLDDHAGRHDPHGNELVVTAPAVADELAGAAELVQGKLGRPAVRRRARPGRPGAARPTTTGRGRRRWCAATTRTCSGSGAARPWSGRSPTTPPSTVGFGAPAGADDVAHAVAAVTGRVPTPLPDGGLGSDGDPAVLRPLARAHGWRAVTDADGLVRMLPPTP